MITKNCKADIIDDTEELEEYHRHIKLLNKINRQDIFRWYDEKKGSERKDLELFMSKFSLLLEMQVECNGCHKKILNGRYKCLQCSSLDLCSSCISGGCLRTEKENQEHKEDHDIIHLVFQCDVCEGYITGTRVWCKECNYHFCFGCYKIGYLAPQHNDTHTLKIIPRIKSKSIAIETYIQQHAWLLYASLALQLNKMATRSTGSIDARYHAMAINLNNRCINMVLNDLLHGFDENELNFLGDPRLIDGCDEQLFSSHLQFKILSLLGMLIPENGKVMNSFEDCNSMSSETFNHFLKTMFQISCSDSMYDNTTKFMAMGLLGRLLARSSLKCADESIESLKDDFPVDQIVAGQKTINFLLVWGGYCIGRGDIEWACSIACMIQKLNTKEHWNPVIVNYLYDCIKPVAKSIMPRMSYIPFALFSMFVLSGFPNVPCVGSVIHYSLNGQKEKPGIVLKHYTDKRQTLIADVHSKKWHKVSDDSFSVINDAINISNSEFEYMGLIIYLIKQTGKLLKEEKKICIEYIWIMSLAQKVLFQIFQNLSPLFMKNICDPELVQCLVQLASQGTGLNKQWLLKDLEVLMLLQYMTKHNTSQSAKKFIQDSASEKVGVKPANLENAKRETDEVISNILNEETDVDGCGYLAAFGLDTTLSKTSDNVCPPFLFNQKFLSENSFEDYLIKEIESSKNDLIAAINQDTSSTDDQTIDTGVQYQQFRGIKEVTSSYASEEFTLSIEDLIASPDDVQNDIEQEQIKKSTELLHKEHKGRASDLYLMQLARAIVVLYSRQLLASLLARWPDDITPITANLFGVANGFQISCIFDLLNGVLPKSEIDEAIENGTQHCHPETLPDVALMACQFLEEENVVIITRESKHNYDNNTKEEEKIHVPGASYLSVTFDSMCCTEEGCDELEFSTSADFQSNLHEVSGVARSNWTSFQVPGDSLYYNFTSDTENTFWGYKFTVTAGFRDRFSTGYLILRNLLFSDLSRYLPLKEIWAHLVHVACKQTQVKRLNTILLLLKILQTQFEHPEEKQFINLSLLRPLWKLYVSLNQNVTQQSGQQPSPVQRALTELFLYAENLAVEWGISNEYLIVLQDPKEIITKVAQGACVVAAIGLAIGQNNSALEAIMEKSKCS